jgi:hypothetical protein
MSSFAIASIAFALVFGGALLGMWLQVTLPEHHLKSDSKDAVKLAMGLVATMVALVLGLLIASAKSSYDTQNNELTDMSSRLVLLDRILAHYGPESDEARDQLRRSVVRALEQMGARDRAHLTRVESSSPRSEELYDKIQALSPKGDAQRSAQSQALGIAIGLGQTRWLMYEQNVNSVSVPLLAFLVFWLTALFMSIGLFAPRNPIVIVTLLVSAFSVSGAILLILEMSTPYVGLIRISDTPLRSVLAQLGQ